MTTYSYTYTLDELEMDLLRFLIQEYLKTATDERRIELVKSIMDKRLDGMEQMTGLF